VVFVVVVVVVIMMMVVVVVVYGAVGTGWGIHTCRNNSGFFALLFSL
jgi:hypothetical protein